MEEQQYSAMPPSQPQSGGGEQNKTLLGVLAYLGPLVIVSYILGKDQSYVKFHVKQGLVLLAIEVLTWVAVMILPFFWMILNLVNLGVFILAIIGIINAAQGKEKELPLVGQFASYFKF